MIYTLKMLNKENKFDWRLYGNAIVVQRHLFNDDLLDLKLILAESISCEDLFSILSLVYKSSKGACNDCPPPKKTKQNKTLEHNVYFQYGQCGQKRLGQFSNLKPAR